MGSSSISQTGNQQYLDGLEVTFTIFLGVQSKGKIKVDLVSGFDDAVQSDEVDPLNRLTDLKLKTVPYRIFPLANQIADKVCAIEGLYSGKPSSRSKDLVDLIVIATTQTEVSAADAAEAIRRERTRRSNEPTNILSIPNQWADQYQSTAANVPACAEFLLFADAQDLMRKFIDPLLGNSPEGVWSPNQLAWIS